ncbi:MAG: YbgA family protein [Clostridium sp.]
MKIWTKPTLIVSKCLGESKCRYDGTAATSKILNRLRAYTNVIEVCPEEGIGLSTPRNTIRLVSENDEIKVLDNKTHADYTKQMVEFAQEMVVEFETLKPTGFLFKGKSPSCGLTDVKIYNSLDKSSPHIKGSGLFSAKILECFSQTPIEEDGRISNFNIREHFLTRLFTLSDFEDCTKVNNINSLIEFHSKNKLLFMSYSQTGLKTLGHIVANHEKLPIDQVYNLYYTALNKQIEKAPKYKPLINTYNHSIGYFTENLGKEEIDFFYETLDKFRNGKVSTNVIVNLLKSYAVRFNNDYLLSQTILEPYPEELIDLCDSGKGIVRD